MGSGQGSAGPGWGEALRKEPTCYPTQSYTIIICALTCFNIVCPMLSYAALCMCMCIHIYIYIYIHIYKYTCMD